MMGRPSVLPLLLSALGQGPATRSELMARAGVSAGAASMHLTALLAERPRRIRICAWRRSPSGGYYEATYELGSARDARKPKPIDKAEKQRRNRQRLRLSGGHEDRKAKDRALYWAKRPPRRDPLAAALFGPA